MSKQYKLGFSLIELSIVILVIGILVIGITKGSRIISESKLKSAQSLTNSSPVASTAGLVAWFETSNNNNLKTSTVAAISSVNYGNISDQSPISAWRDLSPNKTERTEVFAESSDINRPLYVKNGIGGLPSLQFDAVNSYLNTTTTPLGLNDDNYTIIAVWQTTAIRNSYIVGQFATTPANYTAGALTHGVGGNHGFTYYGGGDPGLLTNYTANTPYISIASINNDITNNISVYTNGSLSQVSADASLLNISNQNFRISGRAPDNILFGGFISEIIIFDRNLKNYEILAINTYLSQKYSIRLS